MRCHLESNVKRTLDLIRNHEREQFKGGLRQAVQTYLAVSLHEARKLITQAKATLAAPAQIPVDPKDPLLRSRLIRELRRPITPGKLASNLSITTQNLEDAIEDLESSGYIVHRSGATLALGRSVREVGTKIVHTNHLIGKPISFGVVADMHMCSTSERLDVLEAAYDEFARRKVTTVLCPGNYVDGESRFNQHELKAHGIADQCHYALDHWPQRKGIKTYYVDGDDHEGWFQQREGMEFGRYLHLEAQARGRTDLTYLGYMEADFELKAPRGSSVVKLIHAGGGSSYAFSYAAQKLAESFQGGEKPSVAIIGHYHKMEYSFPRAVHCVQAGCCQDQTRFMRKRKLAAHVGFCIITLQQDIKGSISRFGTEFFPFWDRGYYLSRDGQALAERLQSTRMA